MYFNRRLSIYYSSLFIFSRHTDPRAPTYHQPFHNIQFTTLNSILRIDLSVTMDNNNSNEDTKNHGTSSDAPSNRARNMPLFRDNDVPHHTERLPTYMCIRSDSSQRDARAALAAVFPVGNLGEATVRNQNFAQGPILKERAVARHLLLVRSLRIRDV